VTRKQEPCANCGSADTAKGKWIANRPLTFMRRPQDAHRQMLYLCPSCFEKEMAARERDQADYELRNNST